MNPASNDTFVVVAMMIGLCVGSFLNVVIWRVPRGQSVVRPGSRCVQCERMLTWRANIPVLSWVALRGRARCCGGPIPLRYPLVELACAALFGIVAWRCTPWTVPAYAAAAAGLLALAVIDIEHHRLPDRVLLPTAGLTILALGAEAAALGALAPLASALLGAGIGLAAIGAIHVAKPDGMGFGDVKLAALCGLVLGRQGAGYVGVGLFGAFVAGAVLGVGLLAAGAGRRTQLPFGPFLGASALGVALFGGPIVEALARLV